MAGITLSGNCLAALGCTALLGLLPCFAHAQDNPGEAQPGLSHPSDADDREYDRDMAALQQLSLRKTPTITRRFGDQLRHLDREWPRLLLQVMGPAMPGLVPNYSRSSVLGLQTTLFRDLDRGLNLQGGLGRNFFGEREATVRLTVRF
jgi:hypothetical protein